MTATERLRELLDERGVKWERGLPTETIVREPIDALYVERPDGRMHVYFRSYLTPEQAIAATLGREDTYTREDVESAFVSGYSLGSLPVGSDPQWDENRQTVDEHMAELGWVRKATLGSSNCTNSERAGTCHADETEHIECGTIDGRHYDIHVMECSECGRTYEYVFGGYEFCPNCGRKVVDE